MSSARTAFFERAHAQDIYLGYSDIGLRTERISDVDWWDVDTRSQVSTHCWLPTPMIAAAMNCISENEMGIAMAKAGGAAFIHHVNTPDEQKTMVEDVYHHLAGVIETPFCARDDQRIGDVLQDLQNRKKDFRTLPVTNDEGVCVGLLDEVSFELFEPQKKVRSAMHPYGSFVVGNAGMSPQKVYEKMKKEKAGKIVLLDKARRIGGLCLVQNIKRVIDSNPNSYSLDENGRLIVFASVPTIPEEAEERVSIMKKYVQVWGIDTSHGEGHHAVETLQHLRRCFPDIDILAGNISTMQAARQIARLDPNGQQVGQGPGAICVSADRLGFGTPQASAVYEVWKGIKAAKRSIPVIADGGIRDSADTVKALACGASAVKVGSLVAGTKETPVPIEREPNGAPYRPYWGMGSERAQRAFAAARARYGNYGTRAKGRIFIEGFEKHVPVKGTVAEVIEDHMMGIKLTMAAQGFASIEELRKARFMRGNNKKST